MKNSKVATSKGVFCSKTVKKYLQEKGIADYSASKKTVKDYKTKDNVFRQEIKGLKEELEKCEKPYKIELYFIRDSRRRFDFINAAQLPLDLLTAHGIIEDDNMDEIKPVFLGYEVNKQKAGVIISIGAWLYATIWRRSENQKEKAENGESETML